MKTTSHFHKARHRMKCIHVMYLHVKVRFLASYLYTDFYFQLYILYNSKYIVDLCKKWLTYIGLCQMSIKNSLYMYIVCWITFNSFSDILCILEKNDKCQIMLSIKNRYDFLFYKSVGHFLHIIISTI